MPASTLAMATSILAIATSTLAMSNLPTLAVSNLPTHNHTNPTNLAPLYSSHPRDAKQLAQEFVAEGAATKKAFHARSILSQVSGVVVVVRRRRVVVMMMRVDVFYTTVSRWL